MPEVNSYAGHDLEVLAAETPNYYRWIIEHFYPELHGDVVEYGAGIGTASRLLIPHVQKLDLVEPSVNLAHTLQANFADLPQVRVFDCALEDHIRATPDQSLDGIVLINVLEHIEEDRHAMAQLQRVLRPGGYLFLFVPALQWLMSDLDLHHGHFRRYHLQPLRTALRSSGFDILRSRYIDIPGALAWWLINTVGGKVDFNPRMLSIYDRFVVPVARIVEKIITPPLGKNIILVAQRPK